MVFVIPLQNKCSKIWGNGRKEVILQSKTKINKS